MRWIRLNVYSGLLPPAIYSGMGVGQVMADSIGGGKLVANIVLIMLVLATLLAISGVPAPW